MSADLEALVYRMMMRYLGGQTGGQVHFERHGIVTSYDPETYLAKVIYMPEGQESGPLPIETGHIGEQYGIAVGLQPGDGKNRGDQVIVRFQEGDMRSGKIVQRVHSQDEKPPVVQSGEMIFFTRFRKSDGGPNSAQGAQGGTGQQIYFKNDGSLTVTDGNGATWAADGKGNTTFTSNNHTHNINGDHTVNVKGKRTETISGSLTKSVGGKRSDSVGGSWMTQAATGIWSWLTVKADSDD